MTEQKAEFASNPLGADINLWSRRLDELLTRQVDLYRRLEELGRSQGRLIEDNESDQLLSLLAKRQDVVDQIIDINDGLEPFRRHWDIVTRSLDANLMVHITEKVREIESLAASVAERDQADEAMLRRRRDAVAEQLGGVSRGREALAAYGQPGQKVSQAKFQDHKG